jgi:NADH dehydrogenase [ubiquinone] 1 alpha subcomplex assembly factor 1
MNKFLIFTSLLFMTTTTQAKPTLEYNFGESDCGLCDWFVVLDGVMGGRSKAEFEQTENSAVDNNGGFASIRTPFSGFDLSGFKQVTIRYRSTGQQFAMSLSNYKRFYKPKYKQALPNTNNEWSTLTLKLDEFYKVRLGTKLEGAPSQEDLAEVIRLGLISDEKKASAFQLELDFIRFE